MNNFARAHDQYLTPPEEPEAIHCNDCGEEIEDGETCKYQYCPSKHEGVAAEMAELLISLTLRLRRADKQRASLVDELQAILHA